MKSIQYLTLSVDDPGGYKTVFAKQGDYIDREFHITMTERGQKIIPSSGDEAQFRVRKPDQHSTWTSATINDDGSITVEATEQMLIVPGTIYCDVAIVNASGTVSTATFIINCEEQPLNANQAISTSDFQVLQEKTAEAISAIAETRETSQSLIDMTASAQGLAAGSNPTATVTGGEDGEPFNIAFGIPKGDKGDTYELTQNDKQDIADLIGYETQLRYIRFGTTDPSPSLGNEGDIYIKYIP